MVRRFLPPPPDRLSPEAHVPHRLERLDGDAHQSRCGLTLFFDVPALRRVCVIKGRADIKAPLKSARMAGLLVVPGGETRYFDILPQTRFTFQSRVVRKDAVAPGFFFLWSRRVDAGSHAEAADGRGVHTVPTPPLPLAWFDFLQLASFRLIFCSSSLLLGRRATVCQMFALPGFMGTSSARRAWNSTVPTGSLSLTGC